MQKYFPIRIELYIIDFCVVFIVHYGEDKIEGEGRGREENHRAEGTFEVFQSGNSISFWTNVSPLFS